MDLRKMLGVPLLALCLAGIARAEDAPAKRLRVYHIGNSVTDTINYSGLKALAAARQREYEFGRHVIPGAPLAWIWTHAKEGFAHPPYGYYLTALPKYPWDALTLQPFDRQIEGGEGDLAMAKNYIDLALKSPDLKVYVYERWPRRDQNPDKSFKPFDYQAKWNQKYTGHWDNSNEGRDFFEKLLAAVRKAYPDRAKNIYLVPVGDVLADLDKQMQAGTIPGYKDISGFYADHIHFNNAGSYAVGVTFYATLFRDTPVGLPTTPYEDSRKPENKIPADLAKAIQETAWRVVTSNPDTGVKTPDL